MKNKKKYIVLLAVLIVAVFGISIKITETLSYQKEYKVSAAKMWNSVGNFESVDAFGKSDLKFEFNGAGVGMTRTITFPNGFAIREKLEGLDNKNRILSYSIQNNPKLPYTDYKGQLSVTVKEDNVCVLVENVTYRTKIWKKIMAKKALLYFIKTSFENLETNFK